jgi:type I restriction enzyme S subunit
MPTHQSKIDQLIAELCPNGVVYKTLDEVCEIADNKRKPIKASLRVPGETPYYGANNIQDYVEGYTHDGEYVLLAEDGSASLENYSVQYATGKFWANNHVHVIKGLDEVLNRFLFHWFGNMNFISFLTGGSRAKLTKTKMATIPIPIPPLPIQQEIVRILDTFTKLEAELEARKKQYEYYRDELLNSKTTEFTTLDKISTNLDSQRKPVAKGRRVKGNIPYYGASGIVDYVKDYIFDGDYLLVSEDGANLLARTTPIAFSVCGKSWINNHAHVLEFNSYEERRFIEFYLNSIDLTPYISGAAQPKLNKTNLNKIQIPKYSFAEQERIVSILDKFDALVNDISIGLPAELDARRKQYEYYRDKLLTFKPLEQAHAQQ